MDGVIVDKASFVYGHLLSSPGKESEVTMGPVNPMVGLSWKDSWTVMKTQWMQRL